VTPPRAPFPPISPLPLPVDAGAILLVGGQFDPPHRAHTELPARARDLLGGWLVFVPASKSPLKSEAAAPDADRLAMLRLAIADLDRALVWTDELDRSRPGEPSYWIDTLRRAREILPSGADLRFFIGADQAVQFHRWRAPREILEAADPVVVLRPPWTERNQLLAAITATGAWTAEELDRWSRSILEGPCLPANSTAIREALREHPDSSGSLDLDPKVADYIRRHHLYVYGG
jgi:nicotinate-nucleotide adenylyltransferase